VPLDPLYVIDQHEELLVPSVSKFDGSYQRRLRQYIIDDRHDKKILRLLPDNQFGFVFAYNYFNYRPLSLIFKYLDELYVKLRPGGRVIFTYNDCDFSPAVILAERSFMCYTPGRHIRAHAEQLGYTIEMNCVNPANAAWMELKKPGEIESLRGGQTLAKIIPK
jgi:SAM-dependent methyltransferase